MRNLFPGYYQPTEQEFSTLWEECIFSFDANVLLHIYRYTPKTRDRFFDILDKLKERIWIPHQVAFEYQKERFNVISHQLRAYDEIQKTLNKSLQNLKGELGVYKRHSLIDTNQIIEIFERAIKKVKRNLSKAKQEHPDFITSDELRDKITEILDGKVGEPYSKEKLKTIYKEVEQRFKESIPPGYKDNKKPEPDKYGDVVLWFQLIDYAKSEKKPLIFITDDMKEDWWLEQEGKIISPRPDLIQEMSSEAGVQFYMYSTDRFMDYAESFLKLPDQEEAIEEAREIRIQDAASQRVSDEILHLTDFNPSNREQIMRVLEQVQRPTPAIPELNFISTLEQIKRVLERVQRPIPELNFISNREQIMRVVEQAQRPRDALTKLSLVLPEPIRSSKKIKPEQHTRNQEEKDKFKDDDPVPPLDQQ